LVDLKDDREDFLVRPELLSELAGEVVYKTIFNFYGNQPARRRVLMADPSPGAR
jgi:hypothetical protein